MADSSLLFKPPSPPKLSLPRRFERLLEQAEEEGVKVDTIVQRVNVAATRIDQLLRQVQQGGVGRFEVFLGLSGSGKTTFFKTLGTFFKGATVVDVPKTTALKDVAAYLRLQSLPPGETVAVMYDRDNLRVSDDEAGAFFEDLRVLFREPTGRLVIVWPITDEATAKQLGQKAWSVGRDSVVESEKAAVFQFAGLPKEKYYEVADLTSRTLNSGRSLEVFGLTRETSSQPLREAQTLGEFYGLLESASAALTGDVLKVLEAKTLPAVWILLAGDSNQDVDLTVANLTQGTRHYIDTDRIGELLDSPTAETLYLKEWKERRATMAYLMRLLDVRLFGLPPNVALHAYRAYGAPAYKTTLKQKTTNAAQASEALRATRCYRSIVGDGAPSKAVRPPTADETADEYFRLQRSVGRDTPALNKALAKLFEETLKADGIDAKVFAERESLPGMPNKPDVLIELPDGATICIEPTWRTTGSGIEGELPAQQNTLSVGHIQKYVLEKVLDYVKGLGL